MQIWETTQGLGYLHVNSNYTAAPPATPSLKKANINAAAAATPGRHGAVTSSSSSGREVGSLGRMSHAMKDGDILKQRDFIPLESNNNQNNRASGRAGVGGVGERANRAPGGSLWVQDTPTKGKGTIRPARMDSIAAFCTVTAGRRCAPRCPPPTPGRPGKTGTTLKE